MNQPIQTHVTPFFQEYEKLRVIGRGSFATVYKVRHLELDYVRALKVSHEEIESKEDRAWETFLGECRMLLRIGNGAHQNIVRIYQPRLLDNKAAVEMDYVDGKSLAEYVAAERFIPIDEFGRFANQIVGALAYCHSDIYQFLMSAQDDNLTSDPTDGRKYIVTPEKERELIDKYSVIHNDLHSNNIIRRDYDGEYILLDFGLAIQDNHCVKSSSRGDGAIEYTAPEKLERNLVSKQSDVYSLGILLYEMLTGQVPFPCKGETPESARAKVYNQHLHATPPEILPLRREAFEATHSGEEYHDDIPAGLTDIIMKCLAKNPADRYSDAKALQQAIKECLERKPEPEPKPQPDVVTPEPPIVDINAEIRRQVAEALAKAQKHENDQAGQNPPPPPPPPAPKRKIWQPIAFFIVAVALGIWGFSKSTAEPEPVPVPEPVPPAPVYPSGDFSIFSNIPKTEMVFVEGGTFTMGSDYGDSDERPTHEVTLSDYYIGKYEVTQQLWNYVMKGDGYIPAYNKGQGDTYPVYNVSYKDIKEFLSRLNEMTGKEYCLPREAEWEYAARGGKHSKQYNPEFSGSDTLSKVAWYGEDWNSGSTHPVGEKDPNRLGIYDMSGNVWEWCSDYYDANYYQNSPRTDPTGPPSGVLRVLRGGSWINVAQRCRVSSRDWFIPESRYYNLGFRLACRQVN